MIYTNLRLQNFRSYKDSSFELGKGVNIVVGPNATGKTNLIEAVYLSSLGKTFRTNDNYINGKKTWARIDLHTQDNQTRTTKITPNSNKTQKEFDIDGKIYKRMPIGKKQPTVLFEPNDLSLIHGEPALRRVYIDNICSQLFEEYSRLFSKYKRTLAQRNTLLKQINAPSSQIFVWDIKLSELANKIVKTRLESVDKVNELLSTKYSQISGRQTTLGIRYKTNLPEAGYSDALMRRLSLTIVDDIKRGFTGSGPHRDDIEFIFEDKSHMAQASRGETRSLVLALKLIEVELVEEKLRVKPLLLLDDVFSELDGARRKALTNYLKTHQTIITTTDADIILKNFSKNTHVIILS